MIWFDDRKGRRKNYVVLRYIWGRSYWAMTWQWSTTYDAQEWMHDIWCRFVDPTVQYICCLFLDDDGFSREWINQINHDLLSIRELRISFLIIRVLREAYITFQNTCTSKRRKDFICSFLNKFPAHPPNQSVVST